MVRLLGGGARPGDCATRLGQVILFIRTLLTLVTAAALGLPVLGDTYTGVVSDVKHFHNGGVAVDLDGHYPQEKMALYVHPADAAAVGALPAEGIKVTATGTVLPYKGMPEIQIHAANQWKW